MQEEFISLKDAEGNRFLVNKKSIKTVIEYVGTNDYPEGNQVPQYVVVDFFGDEAIKVEDAYEDIAYQLSTSLQEDLCLTKSINRLNANH